MDELKQKILKEGKVRAGSVVKVDSFLNHQIDVEFMDKIGYEIYNLFKDEEITKVITIEASGVSIAMATAKYFKCRVVFAKKGKAKNLSDEFYAADVMSYTHGQLYKACLSKEFLNADDKVLIVDDFLAKGEAIHGLMEIVKAANATLVGCAVVIEKGFQDGGKKIREQGVRLESLAIIDKIDEETNEITFRN